MTTKNAQGDNPAIVTPSGAKFKVTEIICSSCYFIKGK